MRITRKLLIAAALLGALAVPLTVYILNSGAVYVESMIPGVLLILFELTFAGCAVFVLLRTCPYCGSWLKFDTQTTKTGEWSLSKDINSSNSYTLSEKTETVKKNFRCGKCGYTRDKESERNKELEKKRSAGKHGILSTLIIALCVAAILGGAAGGILLSNSENSAGLKYSSAKGGYSVKWKGNPAFASGEIIISAEYKGSPVVSIEASAFKDCKEITYISLPESLKLIGNNAFDGCSNLEKIIIPANVTLIGYDAFLGCNKNKLTIYVRGYSELPTSWNYGWNKSNCPVVWNYSGS